MKLITFIFYFFLVLLGNERVGFCNDISVEKKALKTRDDVLVLKDANSHQRSERAIIGIDKEDKYYELTVTHQCFVVEKKLSENIILWLNDNVQLVSRILFEADTSPPLVS